MLFFNVLKMSLSYDSHLVRPVSSQQEILYRYVSSSLCCNAKSRSLVRSALRNQRRKRRNGFGNIIVSRIINYTLTRVEEVVDPCRMRIMCVRRLADRRSWVVFERDRVRQNIVMNATVPPKRRLWSVLLGVAPPRRVHTRNSHRNDRSSVKHIISLTVLLWKPRGQNLYFFAGASSYQGPLTVRFDVCLFIFYFFSVNIFSVVRVVKSKFH